MFSQNKVKTAFSVFHNSRIYCGMWKVLPVFRTRCCYLTQRLLLIYKWLCAFTPVRSAGVTFVGCNKSNQKYASVRRPRERNRIPWGNLDYRSLTRLHITRVQRFPNWNINPLLAYLHSVEVFSQNEVKTTFSVFHNSRIFCAMWKVLLVFLRDTIPLKFNPYF